MKYTEMLDLIVKKLDTEVKLAKHTNNYKLAYKQTINNLRGLSKDIKKLRKPSKIREQRMAEEFMQKIRKTVCSLWRKDGYILVYQ